MVRARVRARVGRVGEHVHQRREAIGGDAQLQARCRLGADVGEAPGGSPLALAVGRALLRRHEEGEQRRDRAELAALDLVRVRARVRARATSGVVPRPWEPLGTAPEVPPEWCPGLKS